MSFFEDFTAEDAADLIDDLGERVIFTISGTPHPQNAVPVQKPTLTASGAFEFSNGRAEIEISELRLPPAATRATLLDPSTTIKLDERDERTLRISDVEDTGQRVWRLVCEP